MTPAEFEVISRIAITVAKIETNQINHLQYLDAVNVNLKETKKALDEHIKDNEAHGEATRSKVWAGVGKVLAGISALIAIVVGIYKAVSGK